MSWRKSRNRLREISIEPMDEASIGGNQELYLRDTKSGMKQGRSLRSW